MKSQKHEFSGRKKTKITGGHFIYVTTPSRLLGWGGGEQEVLQALTCHVQEQCRGLRAQAVLASGCHPVDPHRLVDVLDPILDGAHVGVGESVAVAEIQRDARPRTVALCGTDTFYSFICSFILKGTQRKW